MRRVRLEKLKAKMNCPTRVSQPSGCHPAATGGFSAASVSVTTAGSVSLMLGLASGCVRSSNGQTAVVSEASAMPNSSTIAAHLNFLHHARQFLMRNFKCKSGNRIH
jgi:hypothetical protein